MEAMMMMTIASPEASPPVEFISTTTWPSWKLYHNPFYNSQTHHLHHPHCRLIPQFKLSMDESNLHIESELLNLKAELEFERKGRKKAESVNRRLAKEVAEERKARAAVERACGELVRQMAAEMDRMKVEMEEERKMLRMAQVIREERVQMKLAEANILFEQKLSQLAKTQKNPKLEQEERNVDPETDVRPTSQFDSNLSGNFKFPRSNDENDVGVDSRELTRSVSLSMAIQRRASPEKENPHIKRGIKGFVEFPRVVRAIGSKSRKVECQKAQLKILLKHKTPIRSSSLILN